jgi:Putative phage tail protein
MSTIAELKEQAITETPLILFDCEWQSGAIERWSTHGVTLSGHAYQARVLRHNLFELKWGAGEGIDSASRVALTLANADAALSQLAANAGFKGALLTARFGFFDLRTGESASEAMVLFRGLLNPPEEISESTMRLSAHSRLNPQRLFLPDMRIQRRCAWAFPSTAAQRAEAVDGGGRGKYSLLYRCGYSPDRPEGVGNLNAGQPYATCAYTRSDCVERGMFDKDSLNRPTARFSGIEFVPASILVRAHGESSQQVSRIAENQARFNDFVPIHYGTVWTSPPVVFARNDGNLTRIEVLLGAGEIQRLVKVVVNGIEIPQGVNGQSMTATGWYNLVNNGGRNGGFNLEFTDGAGNALGDPYGSLAFAAVSVPNRVSDGRSLPQVQVMLEGSTLEQWSAAGEPLGMAFTNNPAWVLVDLLRRAGWNTEELDLPSFALAAAYSAEPITMDDLYGNSIETARFQCNLSMTRRRSVADWIRGVRQGARLFLAYNPAGKLQVRIEGTIATQQPEKPAGSNAAEELFGGWPAYEFGDGSAGPSGVATRESGEPSLRLWCRATADTPNRSSIEFQDQYNDFQQDSLSLVDTEDAEQSRQEITVASTALGVPNFHQAARVLRLQLDKSVRGNLYLEFETSVKGVTLRPGDIITMTWVRESLSRTPFRITRLTPSLNHWTTTIEAQLHDDRWYSDDPGTATSGRVSRRAASGNVGIPRPLTGAELDTDGRQQFSVIEEPTPDESSAIVLQAGFTPPSKPQSGVDIPLLAISPQVATTGGTLAGGRSFYYAVTALRAEGQESDLSLIARADTAPSTETNRVTLGGLSFSVGTIGFEVYRGPNPQELFRIATGVPVANTFSDTGLTAGLPGPPDANYDHALFDWRLEMLPETLATTFTNTSIGASTLNLLAGEFNGMVVRITGGKGAGQERVIGSHTADMITLEGSWSVVPDGTSTFVVAEPGWKSGASGATSPLRFQVPTRPGSTVQIMGRAVNALGRDSGRDLAPITRWQLGGGSGSGVDVDVPPAPLFGIQALGQGTVELAGVAFQALENTRSIFAGTLTLHYWDELAAPQELSLASNLDATAEEITTSEPVIAPTGSLVQVGAELMQILEADGLTLSVTRGVQGTTPDLHDSGSLVFPLEQKSFVVPFSRGFFGSPASGSFSFPIFLPDVRISAADLFMTNSRGNGETGKASFTGFANDGLRTLSGGQMSIQVEGHLAIQTGAAPELVVDEGHSVRDIFASVRQAPTGVDVQLRLNINGEVYCTLTIPAGSTTTPDTVDGFNLRPLRAMDRLSLDIVSVGQNGSTSPGRDLTVTIRF